MLALLIVLPHTVSLLVSELTFLISGQTVATSTSIMARQHQSPREKRPWLSTTATENRHIIFRECNYSLESVTPSLPPPPSPPNPSGLRPHGHSNDSVMLPIIFYNHGSPWCPRSCFVSSGRWRLCWNLQFCCHNLGFVCCHSQPGTWREN